MPHLESKVNVQVPYGYTMREMEKWDLGQFSYILKYLRGDRERVNNVHVHGMNGLIETYNNIDPEDTLIHLPVMANTCRLKEALWNGLLPTLDEITNEDYIAGLERIREPMIAAERIQNGEQVLGQKVIDTFTKNAHPLSLLVGLGWHIYAEIVFTMAENQHNMMGIDQPDGSVRPWQQEDIIDTLGELTLLRHYQEILGELPQGLSQFRYIYFPNERGGLGWYTPHLVDFKDQFFDHRLTETFTRLGIGNPEMSASEIVTTFQSLFPEILTSETRALEYTLGHFRNPGQEMDQNQLLEEFFRSGVYAGHLFGSNSANPYI